MGFHRVQIRTTVSSFMDVAVVKSAIQWLVGYEIEIHLDKTTSYHGTQIQMLSVELKKNRDIQTFFSKILSIFTEDFFDRIEKRIDDSFVFHLRLDADHLIEKAIIVHENQTHHVMKCEAKIAVYPQQNPVEILKDYIASLNPV